MTKFKIGDRVKVIGQSTICNGERWCGKCKYIGKIGTICSINYGNIGVNKFKGVTNWCSGFEEKVLELVKTEIKKFGIVKFWEKIEK